MLRRPTPRLHGMLQRPLSPPQPCTRRRSGHVLARRWKPCEPTMCGNHAWLIFAYIFYMFMHAGSARE